MMHAPVHRLQHELLTGWNDNLIAVWSGRVILFCRKTVILQLREILTNFIYCYDLDTDRRSKSVFNDWRSKKRSTYLIASGLKFFHDYTVV